MVLHQPLVFSIISASSLLSTSGQKSWIRVKLEILRCDQRRNLYSSTYKVFDNVKSLLNGRKNMPRIAYMVHHSPTRSGTNPKPRRNSNCKTLHNVYFMNAFSINRSISYHTLHSAIVFTAVTHSVWLFVSLSAFYLVFTGNHK